MIYLAAGLSLLCLILVIMLIRLRFALRDLSRQISDLSTKQTNQLVRNTHGQKMLNPLINSINDEMRSLRESMIRTERTDRQIRESLTEISHDLRTPLTAASGYTGMLKNMELTDEEKLRYLNVIEERFETSRELVDQLFYYTRLESDSLGWNEETVDIRKVLSSVLAMYYGDFEKKQFDVDVQIEEKVMPVLGDEDAVKRIFSNILSNGLSHGEGDFRITLSESSRENGFLFSFSNRATEITEEEAAHLFDRFFTKDTARSSSHTGLGLTIAKTLTEKMHGHCEAEIQKNMLTISIFLPKTTGILHKD